MLEHEQQGNRIFGAPANAMNFEHTKPCDDTGVDRSATATQELSEMLLEALFLESGKTDDDIMQLLVINALQPRLADAHFEM